MSWSHRRSYFLQQHLSVSAVVMQLWPGFCSSQKRWRRWFSVFGVYMNELEVWWVFFGLGFSFFHRKDIFFGCGESIISPQFEPTEIQAQQPPASHSDGYRPPSLIICLPVCSEHHKPRFLGTVMAGKFALQGCNTKPTLAMHVSKASRLLYIEGCASCSPSLGAAAGRGATAAHLAGCLGGGGWKSHQGS